MTEEQKRAFDFVVSLRDYFADYHAKKEREAYIAAVLYLGATVGFLTRTWPEQAKLPLLGGIVVATVMAVFLVRFQLANRWFASRMWTACSSVASEWLANAPTPNQYSPARLHGVMWPHAVVQKYRQERAVLLEAMAIVIPVLLFIWGAAVVISKEARVRTVLLPWLGQVASRWSLWAAVFQLIGTALIVWGLRIKKSEQILESRGDGIERPLAVVWKEHPCAFAAGVGVLLLGLVLQVVAAII